MLILHIGLSLRLVVYLQVKEIVLDQKDLVQFDVLDKYR